ncbi:hypothetical protein ROJ8625_02120 [Roseivivax jejudonensis]|uniref:BioF2-like acetyltransferase domain-containing protein n=2 Tax=Roseivivax jejudonensis TaxID=1529041 RepID=A0A1X6Z875_9RHOB|nr:hypothetical protein ROJ8625_02120 [Roseivivax jejudonensis]
MVGTFQQSEEFFAAAREMGWPVQRSRAACGTAWTETVRRVPALGRLRLVSGAPAPGPWLDAAQTRPGTLLVNADAAAGWRQAGFWPLLTPSVAARLTLGPEPEMRARMEQKWRNRLNAARQAEVTTRLRVFPADPSHWLLAAEAAQARARGYRGWPPALGAAWAAANPGAARLVTAMHGTETLAAALILLHGDSATWQIGVSTRAGRQRNAMNAVLWRAMRWCAGRGFARLDLGTLDSAHAPGLARFKLGTGAAACKLGGTWLHHPLSAPLARRLPARLAWPDEADTAPRGGSRGAARQCDRVSR